MTRPETEDDAPVARDSVEEHLPEEGKFDRDFLPEGYTVTREAEGWRARCEGWAGHPRPTFELAFINAERHNAMMHARFDPDKLHQELKALASRVGWMRLSAVAALVDGLKNTVSEKSTEEEST